MSAPDAKTYRDLIDTLVYHLGGASDEKNQVQIRTAIRNAYRDITNGRTWSYYWNHGRLEFVVPYNTGSIAYTNSTRTVTLTGGTFPSTTNKYCGIMVNRVISRIQSMPSGTSLILDPVQNFQQDLAAGSAYTLFQDIYPLPSDFKAMCSPRGESNWWISNYISPEDWMFAERAFGGTTNSGMPTAYTVAGDPVALNGHAIYVWPWPGVAKTYDFMYQRYPRALLRTGYADVDTAGTVTATSGTNALTGSGTSWNSGQVGSAIRLGTSTNKVPTGIEGLTPYQEQFTILTVNSPTSITIDGTLAYNYSGVRHCISDPVDMPDKMLTALIRRVELEIAQLKDRGSIQAAQDRYNLALRLAGESDSVMISPTFMDDNQNVQRPPLRYHPYTQPVSP